MKRKSVLFLVGALALLAIAAVLYIRTFNNIQADARADYEHLRQSGTFPEWTLGRQPIAMPDGGSVGFEATGYRLWRIKRFSPDLRDVECPDYEVGVRVGFTCRNWFPILQRRLVDREQVHLETCRGQRVERESE